MILFAIAAAFLIVTAIVELLFPGALVYHDGWFNVLLVAAMVVAIVRLRVRLGFIAVVAGASIAGFATVASGLLGPDTQIVVAAPGASVRMDALGGSLVFPLAQNGAQGDVLLARGSSTTAIGGRRYLGAFVLETVQRPAVSINVADARGAHLTITQPTGSTFLSPVLLMQSQQMIAGMNLPYDTFAVPAAHRIVKVVLFGPSETSRLPALAGAQHAVLFDVENDNEASLKIGVSRDDAQVAIAGLRLTPRTFQYPAVRVISVPDVRIVVLALLVALFGAIALTTRARTV